ncbi:MAG TPA: hypothetical protein VI011_19635 [Asanoa sp.]
MTAQRRPPQSPLEGVPANGVPARPSGSPPAGPPPTGPPPPAPPAPPPGTGQALSAEERAELERLRAQAAARGGRSRGWRWLGACALLLVAALLGGLAVVAVYLRGQVLDTNTYVSTVAPLITDPPVRQAVADRLTDEIVTRTDVQGLATDVARRLTAEGAPDRINQLVGPAVSGVRSFLNQQIYSLLGTSQFQAAWELVNRQAHDGVVTVLTGGQGQAVSSSGTTVTVDVGALLTAAKQALAAQGLSFVSRIPDVSIQYQLVNSTELPKLRRYADILDGAATWLPFVALALLIAGVLVAPNRRRGVLTGFAMLAVVAGLLLAVLAIGRSYYLGHLPDQIRSPDAAASVLDTVTRYLIAALQALLVLSLILVVGAWLAGPSAPATAVRRLGNKVLDAGGRLLGRAGSWATATGRFLVGARLPLQVIAALVALVTLILVDRPGISAVLWATFGVLAFAALVEMFARTVTAPGATAPAAVRPG